MENQNFLLKWHYHSSTLAYNFPRFLDSEVLTDVTLSAEGKCIKVHRLILASCSAYFLQIFQNTPMNQQPIIVLHNIKYEDLKAIISFIYYGQCLVTATQIPRFLSVAEFLKIQGLSDLKFPDYNYAFPKELIKFDSNICTESIIRNCDVRKDKIDVEFTERDEARNNSKSDELIVSPFQSRKQESYTNDPPILVSPENQQEACLKTEVKATCSVNHGPKKLNKDSLFKCDFCGKILSNQYNLKVHLETHQEGYHACQSCSHVSRSRDALRKHISYRHPQNLTVKKKRKITDANQSE